MRLRSWKQLEELISFVRVARFGELLNSENGATTARGVVEQIRYDLFKRNLSSKIGDYEFEIYTSEIYSGDTVKGYYQIKKIELMLKSTYLRSSVAIYDLYKYKKEFKKDE